MEIYRILLYIVWEGNKKNLFIILVKKPGFIRKNQSSYQSIFMKQFAAL